jgi:hypothetical protein
MAPEPPPHAPPRRDYSALVILAALVTLEIAFLYVLIVVETPLTPVIRRALQNPAGVFTLVMVVVTLLSIGMAGFLWWGERRHKRRSGPGGAA